MSATASSGTAPAQPPRRARSARAPQARSTGSATALLYGVCAARRAARASSLIVLIAYQVVHGASPAISKFGLGFLTDTTWQPNFDVFGAGSLLFGTVVSSFFALLLGAPIAISIGLFLSLLAPTGVRGVISPLVEMLAAIPSVILGFWGILILAPFVQRTHRAVPARHARLHPDLRRRRRPPAPASSPRA